MDEKEDLTCLDKLWDELDEEEAKRSWIAKLYWKIHWKIKNVYWDVRSWPKRLYTWICYGYDPRDLWGLDVPLAKWLYPRLKAFRALYDNPNCHTIGYQPTFVEGKGYENDVHPDSEKIWIEKIDKMLYAIKSLSDNGAWDLPLDSLKSSDIRNGNAKYEAWSVLNDAHHKKVKTGLILLGENLESLWW